MENTIAHQQQSSPNSELVWMSVVLLRPQQRASLYHTFRIKHFQCPAAELCHRQESMPFLGELAPRWTAPVQDGLEDFGIAVPSHSLTMQQQSGATTSFRSHSPAKDQISELRAKATCPNLPYFFALFVAMGGGQRTGGPACGRWRCAVQPPLSSVCATVPPGLVLPGANGLESSSVLLFLYCKQTLSARAASRQLLDFSLFPSVTADKPFRR